MLKKLSTKWAITVGLTLILLGLGFVKGNWKIASADTPTIPTIPGTNIPTSPFTIPAGSGVFTSQNLSFPANPSITLSISVPEDGTVRTLEISNPPDPLPQPNYPIFHVFGQPFVVKIKDSQGNEIHHFNPPLTFTIKYADNDIEGGWNEGNLKFFTPDNGPWQSIQTTVDAAHNTLIAKIYQLSTFAVFDASYRLILPVIRR